MKLHENEDIKNKFRSIAAQAENVALVFEHLTDAEVTQRLAHIQYELQLLEAEYEKDKS